MISIKSSFKWGVYHLFLLTLIFDSMGIFGNTGPFEPSVKFWLRALKLKIGQWNLLKYPLSKYKKQKKMFLEGISQLRAFPIMVWPIRSFWQKLNFISDDKIYATRNEMPTHVHQNIELFRNAAEMKLHVNRTCFHAGLKSLNRYEFISPLMWERTLKIREVTSHPKLQINVWMFVSRWKL